MVENTSKPILGYWSIRGMGAQCAYLLAYCKVDYTFKEYVATVNEDGTRDRGTWPDDKFNLGIGFPNLPYFIDGDVKMAETMPVMRYICDNWKPELLGSSKKEKAEMDMLGAVVNELKLNCLMYPCYRHDDRGKITADAKTRFEPIVKWLGEKKYIMGDNLCYLDFVLLECLNVTNWISDGQIFKDYPTLDPYYKRLREIPEIQDALATFERKPFNNPFAKINHTVEVSGDKR